MDENFLGLKFQPLTINCKEKLEPFLKKYPHVLSGYSFNFLLVWNPVYLYQWFFLDEETLLISIWIPSLNKRHLLEPIGVFSKTVQIELLNYLMKHRQPIKVFRVSEMFLEKNSEFCTHFEMNNERNSANYLYKTEDIASLVGHNYEKKRNLVSQAKNLYDFKTELMSEKCHPKCPKILKNVGTYKIEMSKSLQNELKALDQALLYFEPFNLKGVWISIDNQPVAFSIYTELNNHTVDILFEKADKHFKGLYQLINQETAKVILKEGIEFINREEDIGLEGLRKAKLSYFPIKLIPSYTLLYTDSTSIKKN